MSFEGLIIKNNRIWQISCICQPLHFICGPTEYAVGYYGCPFHAPEHYLKVLKSHLDGYKDETYLDGYKEIKQAYRLFKRYLKTGSPWK